MVRYHAIIYSINKNIAALMQKLLIEVDQVHPQVLVYASKSMISGESQLDVIEHAFIAQFLELNVILSILKE